jgi:hypothetical protein
MKRPFSFCLRVCVAAPRLRDDRIGRETQFQDAARRRAFRPENAAPDRIRLGSGRMPDRPSSAIRGIATTLCQPRFGPRLVDGRTAQIISNWRDFAMSGYQRRKRI